MLKKKEDSADALLKELEALIKNPPKVAETDRPKDVVRCDIEFIPFDLRNNVPSHYRCFTVDIPEFYKATKHFPETHHKTAYDAFRGFCELLLAVNYPFKTLQLTHQAQARLGLANINLIGSAMTISGAKDAKSTVLEAYLNMTARNSL